MNIANLVLSTTAHTFPIVLRTTLRGKCEVSPNQIKQFFEIALERNNTTSPDVVIGACYSVLSSTALTGLTANIVPWSMVKAEFIEALKLLRRTSEYHMVYQRLFYQLTTAMCVDHLVDAILVQFCSFLKFEGSVRYSDDAMKSFFDLAGIRSSGSIVTILDTLYTDIPSEFKERLRHRITVTLTNALEDGAQRENGRIPNRADILKVILVLWSCSPPDVATYLTTRTTEPHDVWQDLCALIEQHIVAATV